jgi:hypothetical protein
MQSILDLGADVDSRYVMVACAAGSFKRKRHFKAVFAAQVI